MLGAFRSAINQIYPKRSSAKQLDAELIRREGEIGGTLFGEVPSGKIRTFVVLDEKTIVWVEEETGDGNKLTTRYEIMNERIVKLQDGQPAVEVSESESINLLQAMRWYHYLVATKLYPNIP